MKQEPPCQQPRQHGAQRSKAVVETLGPTCLCNLEPGLLGMEQAAAVLQQQKERPSLYCQISYTHEITENKHCTC